MQSRIDAISLTQTLVGMNTVNPPGREREAVQVVGAMLEEAGFTTTYFEFADRRTSLVARCGDQEKGKPICVTGHIDTVPLGAIEWSVDPFSGDIVEDKLFGRGSSDMKAGVAAFVTAAIELASDLKDSAGVLLVITAGEETGCDGARHLAGVDGALTDVGAIVVGEPTANYPLVGHKGALWLDITTRGVTAHGSMPEQGVNAIYRGARLVTKLESYRLDAASHEILGAPTINVGTVEGGMNVNSVPDVMHIGVDLRTVPGMNHKALQDELSQFLAPEMDQMSPIVDLPPVWTDLNDRWVQQVFDVCARHLGCEPGIRGVNYFTDACILKPVCGGVPVIILGPGQPELAHQTDEYCFVYRIEQAVELYTDIIAAWCDTDQSAEQPVSDTVVSSPMFGFRH